MNSLGADAFDGGAGGLVEPLGESAPLAWTNAPGLCYRHPESGDTCLWYHRVWQYLRLLGIISTTRTNTDFLVRSFRERARTGNSPRVLVSAAADYSMLAHLRYTYEAERQVLDATVVNRCETPLLLNRWYADRYRMALSTSCLDLLEYTTERPFNLICTHNLLTRFDVESRSRLVGRWRTLLRPGGVVITTQRIRPNAQGVFNTATVDEARELSERVARAAGEYTQRLDVSPEELCQAVFEYAVRRCTYMIRTTREIVDIFEANGFDVELADEGGGKAERERDRPLSKAGKDTYRMRIVARKR